MDELVSAWENDVSARVRPMVLSSLPDSVLALLDRIEKFAGTSVLFRDTEILRLAGGPHPNVEALYCDHERAYVSVPDPTDVNPNAVLHELLHLERYWVEGVPQLEPVHDIGQNVEALSAIDNNLEHLIIVPRERDYGYDPSPYWSTICLATIRELDRPNASPNWLQGAAVAMLITASLTTDEVARGAVQKALQSKGLLEFSESALHRIVRQRATKPRMARAALKAAKIPLKQARLVTFDIRKRAAIRRPVPEL